LLALELIDVLRTMIGNIDSKLFHNSDRLGSYAPRFCAGTFDLEAICRVMGEQPFSHLTAGGITRAEN